jgi:hypothetical protein
MFYLVLTVEEQERLYSRNIESFVKEEKGKKIVDWESIERLRKNEREGTHSEEFYRKISWGGIPPFVWSPRFRCAIADLHPSANR